MGPIIEFKPDNVPPCILRFTMDEVINNGLISQIFGDAQYLVVIRLDTSRFEFDAVVSSTCYDSREKIISALSKRKLGINTRDVNSILSGGAIINNGFYLKVNVLINFHEPQQLKTIQDENQLRDCYYNAMDLAGDELCESIAFLDISNQYPIEQRKKSIQIALETIENWCRSEPYSRKLIVFCCPDSETYDFYRKVLLIDDQSKDQQITGAKRYSNIGFLDGWTLPIDINRACNIIENAAQFSCCSGLYELVFSSVQEDSQSWIEKTVCLDDEYMQCQLIYYRLNKCINENERLEVIQQLEEYASKGNDDAQLYLALLYMEGHFVTKNIQKGFVWFKKAWVNGNENARMITRKMHRNIINP